MQILEDQGYSCLEGIDCSPFQVEYRISSKVHRGDALTLLRGKKDASLDVVIAFDVIEHLNKDELLEWIREVHRVLAPQGRWILHTPNASGLFGNRVRYGDLTHESAFTVESLRQLGEIAGFRSLRVSEDKPIIHGLSSGIRRIIWEIARLPLLLVWIAETGDWRDFALSQNITALLFK